MLYYLALEENSSAHAWNYIDILIREKEAKRTHVQWVRIPLFVQTIFVKKDNQGHLSQFLALKLIVGVCFVGISMA